MLPESAGPKVCCERCPGANAATTAHLTKRGPSKKAVFGDPGSPSAAREGARLAVPRRGRAENSVAMPGVAAQPAAGRGEPGRPGTGYGEPGRPGPRQGEPGQPGAGHDWAGQPGAGWDRAGQAGTGRAGLPDAPPEEDPGAAALPRAVTGHVTDISPHFITIGDPGGEQRFALTADARAWRGGTLEPSALRHGDEAVIRLRPGRARVADRIWANIGRVTGQIVSREGDMLLVSESSTGARPRLVLIPPRVASLIRVRCHNLQPGYLIDMIGIRRHGILEAVANGAYQPGYRADDVPEPSPHGGRTPDYISGTATWREPGTEPHGLLGVSYPAIDPDCGCAEARAEATASHPVSPFRNMPFLAVGSMLAVRNDCNGLHRTLPVTACAPFTRRFNDRCLECGTPERGRIAELTLASFVALGGELEQGCFNATITIGR